MYLIMSREIDKNATILSLVRDHRGWSSTLRVLIVDLFIISEVLHAKGITLTTVFYLPEIKKMVEHVW